MLIPFEAPAQILCTWNARRSINQEITSKRGAAIAIESNVITTNFIPHHHSTDQYFISTSSSPYPERQRCHQWRRLQHQVPYQQMHHQHCLIPKHQIHLHSYRGFMEKIRVTDQGYLC